VPAEDIYQCLKTIIGDYSLPGGGSIEVHHVNDTLQSGILPGDSTDGGGQILTQAGRLSGYRGPPSFGW
jgi:hypothetical protein